MKQMSKWVAFGLILLLPFHIANARTKKLDRTYYGVDLQYTYMKGKNDWEKIMRKGHPGFNLFIGHRFTQHLGLEFGYSFTTRKTANLSVANGSVLFGQVNNAGVPVDVSSQVKMKNTHFDLNGYYPIKDKLEAIASIGIGFSRQAFDFTLTPASNIDNALNGIKGKTNALLRAGLGLQGNITKTMGLRGMLRYDNTSSVKLRGVPVANASGASSFRDSYTIALGVYWKV